MNAMVGFNFDTQVILDALGSIQGITLGILLVILNRRNYRSTLFLGFFLFFFSLELVYWIFKNHAIVESYPKLLLLPFNFQWLLFPLFFIYTQQVSVLSRKKTKYWLLIPGIISFLAQVFIFWLPFETRQLIAESNWHRFLFWDLGDYYSWIIAIWNLRLLYRHKIEVQNTYSYITYKELQWARIFLIYLLTISVVSHLISNEFMDIVFKDNTVFSVMDLIAIYWVAYRGILQRNVLSVFNHEWNSNSPSDKPAAQKQSQEMDSEKLEGLMYKIEDYMAVSESFSNPNLTVVDVAEGIKVHPRLISKTINSQSKQNFNAYVNQLRIKKAERLLKDQKEANWSMEGIGSESGFKSKSAFYSAFKKQTGTTPSQFKELSEQSRQSPPG
jgi:AraC-like DNA-binding protein